MLKEAFKKSALLTAVVCGLGCTALCVLLTGLLSLPVYGGKLRPEKIEVYIIMIRFLSALVFSALTAKIALSRKLPFALLCGGTALAVFLALGAICFESGGLGREFGLCAASLLTGSAAGGVLAAMTKKKRR